MKPKELHELGPGDKVLEGFGTTARVLTITRVTATQIIINAWRFNRRTGRRCGESSGWCHSSIHVATKEGLDACEKNQLIGKLYDLRARDLEHLTLDQLKTIFKIIGKP